MVNRRSLKENIRLLRMIGAEMEICVRNQKKTDRKIQDKLLSKVESLKEQKIRQYESYADGRITRDAYIRKRDEIDSKIADLKEQVDRKKEFDADANADLLESMSEIRQLIKEYSPEGRITFEALDAFIDAVYVYDQQRMEIVFRFGDAFQKSVNLLSGASV